MFLRATGKYCPFDETNTEYKNPTKNQRVFTFYGLENKITTLIYLMPKLKCLLSMKFCFLVFTKCLNNTLLNNTNSSHKISCVTIQSVETLLFRLLRQNGLLCWKTVKLKKIVLNNIIPLQQAHVDFIQRFGFLHYR